MPEEARESGFYEVVEKEVNGKSVRRLKYRPPLRVVLQRLGRIMTLDRLARMRRLQVEHSKLVSNIIVGDLQKIERRVRRQSLKFERDLRKILAEAR